MQETLVTIGVVCVIAAVVGGRLAAGNIIKIEAIESVGRQVLLAVVGAAIAALGLFGLPDDSTDSAHGNGNGNGTPASTGSTESRPSTATTATPAEGRGGAGVCRNVVVRVTGLERREGKATFQISIRNDGEQTVKMPVLDRLALVDDQGRQWPADDFGNLGGGWRLGPAIGPRSTADVDVVFRAVSAAATGRLTIREVHAEDEPFTTCALEVRGFGMPT